METVVAPNTSDDLGSSLYKDYDSIENDIYNFITGLSKPISPNEIGIIRKLAKKLERRSSSYKVVEKDVDYCYELDVLSLKHTDKINIVSYANQKIYVYINVGSFRYTQYEQFNETFQTYEIRENVTTIINLIFDKLTNKHSRIRCIITSAKDESIDLKCIFHSPQEIFQKVYLLSSNIIGQQSNITTPISIAYDAKTEKFNFDSRYLGFSFENTDGVTNIICTYRNNEFICWPSSTTITIQPQVSISNVNFQKIELINSMIEDGQLDIKNIIKGGDTYLINILSDPRLTYYRKIQYCSNRKVFDGVTIDIKNKNYLISYARSLLYQNRFIHNYTAEIFDKSVNQNYQQYRIFTADTAYLSRLSPMLSDPYFQHQYIVSLLNHDVQLKRVSKVSNELLSLKIHTFDVEWKPKYITEEIFNPPDANYLTRRQTTDNSDSLICKSGDNKYAQTTIRLNDYTIYHERAEFKSTKNTYATKLIRHIDKTVYHGTIVKNKPTVFINLLSNDDSTKLGITDDHYENIKTLGVRLIPKKRIVVDKPNTKEIIHTADPNFKYEFIYSCGIGFSSQKTVVLGHSSDEIKNVAKYEYDKDGNELSSKNIDSNNMLNIKHVNDGLIQKKYNRLGYKAARTPDGMMVIVTLMIPNTAKVAWDYNKDKYRTDRAVVLSIKPVVYGKQNHYYVKDFQLEECPICFDEVGTHMALPCRHKLCGDCWVAVITTSNDRCPYCKTSINRIINLKQVEDDNYLSLPEALSAIHTSDFVYRAGEEVQVLNFDGDLKKVCAPGVHYHETESDVFQWFEYMNIPDDLLTDQLPWITDPSSDPTVANHHIPAPEFIEDSIFDA
jgi:hypothetical protein